MQRIFYIRKSRN